MTDKLKEEAIKMLLKMPDKKMVSTQSSYTCAELAELIRIGDPVGEKLLVDIQLLALDLIIRNKA